MLEVEHLHALPERGSATALRDLSFAVKAGEVLGLGGLMGAGRSETLLHLFGAWGRRTGATVRLAGAPYPEPTPSESIARGLVLAFAVWMDVRFRKQDNGG